MRAIISITVHCKKHIIKTVEVEGVRWYIGNDDGNVLGYARLGKPMLDNVIVHNNRNLNS